MSKRAAVRVDHLADIPLDRAGVFLRAERRFWVDGTSCLHVAKWGFQPNRKRPAPWFRPQFIQVRWEMAGTFLAAWSEAHARLPSLTVIALDTDTSCFLVEQSESGDYEQVQKYWRRPDGSLERFRQAGSRYAYQRLPLPRVVVPRVVDQLETAIQTYFGGSGEQDLRIRS